MLRRRTWLMAVPAAYFAALGIAQGCGGDNGATVFPELDSGDNRPDTAYQEPDAQFSARPREDGSSSRGDGGWEGAACATSNAVAFRLPIYMQIVLDGSGSMDGIGDNGFIPGSREMDPLNNERITRDDQGVTQPNGLTGKKWLAARGALGAFWHRVAGQNSTTFGVGLYLFSSTDAKPSDQIDVALKSVNAAQEAALNTRVVPQTGGLGGDPPPRASRVYPSGGTPLLDAISGQGKLLAKFDPTESSTGLEKGGKRVLVVITDGVPTPGRNGDAGGADRTQQQENELVKAAAAGLSNGNPSVTTFVIGVGNPTDAVTDYDERFLAQLAIKGGAADPSKCNPNWGDGDMSGEPCHFQITPGSKSAAELADEFNAAITKIRDVVVPCEFALERQLDAGQVDPDKVNVVYTPGGGGPDTQIGKDTSNGWTYDGYNSDAGGLPSKVILNGNACKTLKNDAGGKVRIVLGCKTGDPVIKIH
ncbi:hypothetical protein [Pendulispora albinea]|uniref:VWA domain-containing protein n=1 Tax=Pendulispora albinea TaxID=2741071 RepID=A0ABZ2LXK0_9BACT